MNALKSSVVFCAICVHCIVAVTKTWTPNTNYDNANNWDLARLPCSTDRVIFPSQLESAVQFRDGSTTLMELVLPTNGEIMLPLTGSVTINGDSRPEQECRGEDIVFTRSWSAAWLDPDNWKTEGQSATQPVPHLERIPCAHDRIVFPEGSSFRVRLPEVTVIVGKISLLGQDMTPNEWEDALLTEPGERQFVTGEGDFTRTSSVVITGQERCSDKTGCSCEGHSELRAAVCRYTRNNNGDCYDSSRKTTCVAPVQPLGHCCAFCGAYLLLEYSASKVELGRLHSLLESYLRQDRYSSIAAHVGKPAMVEDAPRNRLQIVLADAGVYRGDCGDLADTLAAELRNNDHFGVSGVTVYASGEPLRASTWASVFGTLLGTLAAALIVLGLIFFVFTNYRPNGWVLQAHPILFARFENALSESEEAVESRVEMMPAERSTGHQASAAFDNPMYGKTKAEEGEEAVPPRGEPGKQEAHDNPVYSELLLKDEPQEGASDVQVT